jgi:hypothetical protein
MRAIYLFLLLTPSLIAQDTLQQARDRLKSIPVPEPVIEAPEQPETPPAPEPDKPSVTFSLLVSAAPAPERYLAVGPNCPACPRGKANFLASGGKPEHVIDFTVANSQYGQNIKFIPQEFTVQLAAPPSQIVATTEGVDATPETVVSVLAAYLEQQAAAEASKSKPFITPDQPLYGGWFEYDVNVPDSVPSILQKLMKDKQYKSEALGLLLIWPGNQTIKLETTSIKIDPPIQASVRKLGITASASISEVRFTSDYKSVTVITPEVMIPDLTINFK